MALGSLAVAGATAATLPVGVVAAIGIATGIAASKFWGWLWDNGAADFYGIKPGDELGGPGFWDGLAGLLGGLADDAAGLLGWLFPDGEGGAAGSAANAGSAGATLAPPPRRYDPLVLDLDGDGLEFTNLADSQAMFDLSGDQFATRTAWLKGDDGFLVLDQNGDGVVNGIDELFGSDTEGGFA